MGGRELPTECPHGRIIDPGDFGESSEGCDACGIPAATWDDDGNITEEPRTQHRRGPAMTEPVRALTLWQPWSSAVPLGLKTVETRGWSTKYRGVLLITAAATDREWRRIWDAGHRQVGTIEARMLDDLQRAFDARDDGGPELWGPDDPDTLPLGAVVAVATLTDVVPIVGEDGDLTTADPPCIEHRPTGAVNAGLWQWSAWSAPDDEDDCRDITHELLWGDYTPGRFGWLLDDVRPLAEPVPCKGRQGLWTPDDDLLAAVQEQTKETLGPPRPLPSKENR